MNSVALSFGLIELFLTSIVFCVVTVAIARAFGPRAAWLWWSIALAAQVAFALIGGSAGLAGPGNPLVNVYMWGMIWCLPTALAVWASVRTAHVDPPGVLRHFARTYGVFILASVVGIVLGVIPVFTRMF